MNNTYKDNLDPILSGIINSTTGKIVIIPNDHLGLGTEPIKGYSNGILVQQLIKGGADVILDHLGGIERIKRMGLQDNVATILHMSISSPIGVDPNSKVLVNSVELASKLGVKGVSLQVNMGHPDDHRMLQDLSRVAVDCRKYGLPLLAMMYIRSKEDGKKETKKALRELKKNIGLSARMAEKLGAHIVKLPYTGDKASMKRVVKSVSIPVVVAGGAKMSDLQTLQMVADAMDAECAGICMGRNSVERGNVKEFIGVIRRMVHEKLSVEEAKKILKLR